MRTDRLLLREFRPDDLDGYAAMCADPEVMRYLSPDGAVLSRDDAWRQMAMFAGHWALRGYGMWVVEQFQGSVEVRGLPHHLYRLVNAAWGLSSQE